MDRREFLGVAGASAAAVALTNASTAHAALPTGASSYVSLPSARFCDTRKPAAEAGMTRLDSKTIRVQITGRLGVPATATAIVVGITAVDTAGRGFVTAYPTGIARPTPANLNFAPAQIIQNMAIVRIGTGGAIDLYHHAGCHLLVDLFGAFVPTATAVSAGRFVPLSTPVRALDTRWTSAIAAKATAVADVSAQVPAGSSAAVVRLHCPISLARGFFSLYEDGIARPESSHMNCDGPYQVRSAQAVVPLSPTANRKIRVYSHGGGHAVVEVVGYITGSSAPVSTDGLFVPANIPLRQVDTREIGGWNIVPRDWVAEAPMPSGVTAQAAAWNFGGTMAIEPGYFTAYPARTARPRMSHMTAQFAGQVVNAHTWSRVSTSGLALTSTGGAGLIGDYAGYFMGSPTPATTGYVGASGPANPSPPYTLSIPRLGISMSVNTGSVGIVDYGLGWIMPGSVLPGQQGPTVIFAHRTSAGGPFRYINGLTAGDEITLTDAWGRKWVYRMAARYITGSSYESITDAVWRTPTPSISLVACSKLDGTATSLSYRIVVNATREYVLVP